MIVKCSVLSIYTASTGRTWATKIKWWNIFINRILDETRQQGMEGHETFHRPARARSLSCNSANYRSPTVVQPWLLVSSTLFTVPTDTGRHYPRNPSSCNIDGHRHFRIRTLWALPATINSVMAQRLHDFIKSLEEFASQKTYQAFNNNSAKERNGQT